MPHMKPAECSNCKHWLTDQNERYSIKEHGRCLAVVQYDSYEDTSQSRMIAMDGSGYFAALFTKPSHHCAEWSVIEPGTKEGKNER